MTFGYQFEEREGFMSTRCNIAIKENGHYTYIYNHYDSYLYGLGITLYKHYKDVKKVKQLIALGDLSSVGSTVEVNCNAYEERTEQPLEKRGTVAYYRDGNRWSEYFGHEDWEDVKPNETDDINDLFEFSYTYIFDVEENCWYVSMRKEENKLYKLEELLHSKELLESVIGDSFDSEYREEIYNKCLEA